MSLHTSMIQEKAVETLNLEAQAVARLTERIDDEFEAAVRAIL
ncbi:MAG: KpsF/GutQ family sugar-phosphate isomerase, partial [Selenomonas artemidis]|nr:KpsF/GutQ family sugar-phosphate isomerase [Selenomonas artemidis]